MDGAPLNLRAMLASPEIFSPPAAVRTSLAMSAEPVSCLYPVLILLISYIQSYFPPERTKKILGKFKGIWANIIAALLGFLFLEQIPDQLSF